MIRTAIITTLGLLSVGTMHSQSEPGHSPVTGPSQPPSVRNPARPPAQQSPAPIVATPKNGGGMGDAQPHTEKNPPPLDSANIDTSVKPEDDFFRYANGSWLKKN